MIISSTLNINYVEKKLVSSVTLPKVQAILINDKLELDKSDSTLNDQTKNAITKLLKDINLSSKEFGKVKILSSINDNSEINNIILIGIGDDKSLKSSCIEKLGAIIINEATKLYAESVCVKAMPIANFADSEVAALLGNGAFLTSYKFYKYFTKLKDEEKFITNNFEIECNNIEAAKKSYETKKAVTVGVHVARNLVSEPPNYKVPELYATKIVDLLEPFGVEVEVLGEREMKNLGMGALLGVGQGSQNESKLVVMKYIGKTDDDKMPLALVGKGVTFDTGGISLKPSLNMADMKHDMAGSAAVVGTILALAQIKADVNIVGVVGLVENMPGGSAQRPADVVITMSGQTAEVLDTDAEGRLVLADAVWYAQEKFKPQIVIDLATLTGAITVALGTTYAGCFANNDKLAEQLIKAGDEVDEKLWRMPLHKDYNAMLKSEIADVANLGNGRGLAGSSTGAHFIGRFIKDDTTWAHLDIAGMAWDKKGSLLSPKGATGYGVRLLTQFIQNYHSNK